MTSDNFTQRKNIWNFLKESLASFDLLWFFLLLLFIIKFSSAWIWGGGRVDEFGFATNELDIPFAKEFQAFIWLCVVLITVKHIKENGFNFLILTFKPFSMMFFVGLLAGALGTAPFSSFRLLGLWLVTVLAATIVGHRLAQRQHAAIQSFLWSMLLILTVSLILVALNTSTQVDVMGEQGWLGAFANKNTYGWISAISLVFSISSISRDHWRLPLAVVIVAGIGVIGAESRASLIAALGTISFICLYRLVIHKVSPGFGIIIQLTYLCLLAFFAQVLMPIILELVGKDATFTGRTEIWAVYIEKILETPWLGQGPGAFTGESEITLNLLSMLSEWGYIYTPHNMYLGAFGDSGLFGLIVFVGTLIYVTFIAPLSYPGNLSNIAAAIGFLIMIGGFAETHQIYSSGFGIFVLMYLRALSLGKQSSSNQ